MTAPDLSTILKPELAEFAQMLLDHDFKVYVFTSDVNRVARGGRPQWASHIGFSRDVDGQLCWASVDGYFSGYQFHMPIKPSRENGSAMFIGGDRANEFDDLTLTNAELYASPYGSNRLVGRQRNHGGEGYRHLYTEVTTQEEVTDAV